MVDDGTPQTVAVVANCDTLVNCAAALSSLITGATVTVEGNNLKVTSDTTGLSSTIAITATGSGVNALALFGTNSVAVNGGVVADGNGNGVPDFLDPKDSDGDGIPDHVEIGSNPNNPNDTDGDSTPDYQDLDRCVKEFLSCSLCVMLELTCLFFHISSFIFLLSYFFFDISSFFSSSDGDGIPDAIEKGTDFPTPPVDTDSDGIPDYKDADSNGDGIFDSDSKGPSECCEGNGAIPPGVGTPIDTDLDGIPDYKDEDADNDGISNNVENGVGGPDGTQKDTGKIGNLFFNSSFHSGSNNTRPLISSLLFFFFHAQTPMEYQTTLTSTQTMTALLIRSRKAVLHQVL